MTKILKTRQVFDIDKRDVHNYLNLPQKNILVIVRDKGCGTITVPKPFGNLNAPCPGTFESACGHASERYGCKWGSRNPAEIFHKLHPLIGGRVVCSVKAHLADNLIKR